MSRRPRDPAEPVDLDVVEPALPEAGRRQSGRGLAFVAGVVAASLVVAGIVAVRRHTHDVTQATTHSSPLPQQTQNPDGDQPGQLVGSLIDERVGFLQVVLTVNLTDLGDAPIALLGLRGAPDGFELAGLDRSENHDLDHPAHGPLVNPLVVDPSVGQGIAITYRRIGCPSRTTSDPLVLAADIRVPEGRRTVPVEVQGIALDDLFAAPTPGCQVAPPTVAVPPGAVVLRGVGTRRVSLQVSAADAAVYRVVQLACLGTGSVSVAGLSWSPARVRDCSIGESAYGGLPPRTLAKGSHTLTVTAPDGAGWTIAIFRTDQP